MVVQKFATFAEAERADRALYRSMSGQQRLDLLLDLIARHLEMQGEAPLRLARVHRVTQLPRR
jgi:hypothetical protein